MLHPVRKRNMRIPMLTASVPFLLIGLAACGSDSKSSSTTAAAAPAATTAAAPAATTTAAPAATTAATTTAAPAATTPAATGGTPVAVTESEFKIDLPQTSFTAGAYTFNITNSGKFKHNLIFTASDGTTVKSDTLEGGATGSVNVSLAAGSYEVYCGVPTHKGKGMDLTITVT